MPTPATSAKAALPLAKYRLGRAALDLRAFTVGELVGLTQVPPNTVYGFLHELGPGVTKETVPSDTPGRPRKRYSLTKEGVEKLIDENLGLAHFLRSTGLDAVDDQKQSPSSTEVEQAVQPAARLDVGEVYERYLDRLSDLHTVELQAMAVLPRVTKRISDETLRTALEHQIKRTKQQHARLDRILKKLRRQYAADTRYREEPGFSWEDVEARVREETEPRTRDTCLAAAAQTSEHYRVAGYGSVYTFAELLGDQEAADLLRTTLDEELQAPNLPASLRARPLLQ